MQFQVTGEMLMLILAVVAQVVGTFMALSNIRVDMAERMTRLETHITHILGVLGVKVGEIEKP